MALRSRRREAVAQCLSENYARFAAYTVVKVRLWECVCMLQNSILQSPTSVALFLQVRSEHGEISPGCLTSGWLCLSRRISPVGKWYHVVKSVVPAKKLDDTAVRKLRAWF